MAGEGKKSAKLPPAQLINELIGNRTVSGGVDTARIAVNDFATQLLASGPVGTENAARKAAIAAHAAQLIDHYERIDVLESAAYAGRRLFTLWSVLLGVTGTANSSAEVLPTDTGTHVDPLTSATVPNAGIFAWTSSGWHRVFDNAVMRRATPAEGRDGVRDDVAMSPSTSKNAIDDRFGPLDTRTLSEETGFSVAFRDLIGRIAFGIKTTGQLIGKGILPVGIITKLIGEAAGFAWVLTTPNNRIMFGVRPNGKIVADLSEAISPTVLPIEAIDVNGDSMSAGYGGGGAGFGGVGGTSIATVLATLTGWPVVNNGIGGQVAKEVAARQGGMPMLATVAGNQIPASGPVAITFDIAPITYDPRPFLTRAGTLAGIPGVVSATNDLSNPAMTFVFTRSTPGTAKACPANTQFFLNSSDADRGKVGIYWCGRNDTNGGTTRAQRVATRDAILSMIRHKTSRDTRVLVLSVLTSQSEATGGAAHTNVKLLNAELQGILGDRFCDVRRYLIDYALADMGIAPTSQDNTNIANDTVPSSFLSDGVHLNAAGYTAVARFVYRRMISLGWI